MKPGKKDIPLKIKIAGRQLEELQKHTWHMCEAFGLDMKIENYKGARPISLYSWDLVPYSCISIIKNKKIMQPFSEDFQ